MSAHTPGPWEARAEWLLEGKLHVAGSAPTVYAGKKEIAKMTRATFKGRDKQAEANARLIAAAPDMLAILKKATTASRAQLVGAEFWNEVDAVIAKAEGA